MRTVRIAVIGASFALALTGCGGGGSAGEPAESTTSTSSASPPSQGIDQVVEIDGARGLYVRCAGNGSPTVVMEGGDGDASDPHGFVASSVAAVTRTCVYDRANLGRSDAAPGPRQLDDLVADLERLLTKAQIPEPYVLVGTSGGGYITAGYAVSHPFQTAGMVFIDVAAPFRDPPPPVVAETAWDHPENVERRDFLQVEKDAWAARKQVGDIPVTIVSVEYADSQTQGSVFPSEQRAMRRNVQDQKGWLVLSPQAKQRVVHTGHAVEEEDPQLVVDVILGVVRAART